MKNADKNRNLERLETIGDSILDLAIAIYVSRQEVPTKPGQSLSDDLSEARARQVENSHLCSLGKKLELTSIIAAEAFDLKNEFPAAVSGRKEEQTKLPKIHHQEHRRLRGGLDRCVFYYYRCK